MADKAHLAGRGPNAVTADGSQTSEERWMSLTTAAYCRILSIDSGHMWQWCYSHGINEAAFKVMLHHLERHCSATRENVEDLKQDGAYSVSIFPSISGDEQVQCLMMDLHVRETIQASTDLQQRASVDAWNRGAALPDVFEAIQVWLRFNSEQIENVYRTLSQQLASDTSGGSHAMAGSRAPSPGMTAMPLAKREPLTQASPNVPLANAIRPVELSKRKRDGADNGETLQPPLLESDTDDEQDLQHKANDLHVRIASIRARTANEDVIVARKKIKNKREPGRSTTTHPESTSPMSALQEALRANSRPSAQLSSALATRKIGAPTPQGVKLILKRQGLPDYRCKASPRTTFDKIVSVAKKEFGIPQQQAVCLHFRGQRLSLAELVHEAGMKDHDQLQVLDLRPHGCEQAQVLAQQDTKLFESGHAKPVPSHAVPSAQAVSPLPVVDLTLSSPPQAQTTAAVASSAALPAQAEPPLCAEQQEVVDAILAGRNVFYTGSAGCGKSTVLKAFVPRLRDMGKTVRILAPTGKAALDINGSTTWTFAGWTPGHMKRPLADLVKAAHGKFVSKRFRETDVLVIDEVSMVENQLLTRLSTIMQAARENERPFGGVQLIVTGDFCQLPPVKPFAFCMECGREQIRKVGPRGETLYRCQKHGDCNDDDKWAFRSKVWEQCNFKHVNLTNIHRQSDEVFIGVLQKLRIGKPLTAADRQLLLDHPCDVTNAVKLFPTREEVRRINQTEFDRLRTAKREFRCLDFFSWNEVHGNLREKGRRSPVDDSLEALREHRLDTLVEFKAGMLVVLLVNLDIAGGLVNGSQGRVIGFEPFAESKLPKAAARDGQRYGSFSHPGKKSRSGRQASPEPPQGMVQGELRGEYTELRQAQIREFILQSRNQNKMWPIVEFENGVRRTIYADCQLNELGDEKPYTLLGRTQIPLIAAWAMTIHKSQGMTLNRVIVDLGRSFEEGQEYVALSRARSLEGLKVTGLGDNVGKGGNEQVKQFLKEKFNLD